MSARDDPIERGRQKGLAAQHRFQAEIREARLTLGKSQRVAASEAGIDPAVWSRLERGAREALTLGLVGRMAAAVGLDAVLQFYPADRVLRDIGHVKLLRDVRTLLGAEWRWRYEVLVGTYPDQRAWDAVATHPRTGTVIHVEAETRLRDCQALMRRIESKRAVIAGSRVVLAIRSSRGNRIAVDEARDLLASAFPVPTREALAALRGGTDPGGDAIVLVDWQGTPVSRGRE